MSTVAPREVSPLKYLVRPRHRLAAVLAVVVAVASLAALPGSSLSGAASGPKAPIKVAGLFDLTGGDAAAGLAVQQATEYAVNQQNKKGGIQGHKIDLVSLNDASDPATGVLEFRKAVDQDGIKIILGPTYSPVAAAICPLGQEDHVLIFTQSATNPTVTTPYQKYCYGNAPTANESATAIVKLMKSMGKKKIGMILDNSVYGSTGLTAIKADLKGTGMTLTATSTIDVTATDGTAQATAMKQAGVDAVVLAAVPIPGTAALKAFYQQGVGVPMYSFGGIFLPATAQLVTSSAPVQFYMTSPATCPQAQFFVKCGQSAKPAFPKGSSQPGYGIFAYYPTMALFTAMQKAKGFSPDQVITALDKAPAYQNDFTVPIKYTPKDHLGVGEQLLEGYKGGKLYFFGGTINQNTYKP
jgi:ABC-type branched-subunit amino acid transport system substrate-binding protein